jgi:hypothetical protein
MADNEKTDKTTEPRPKPAAGTLSLAEFTIDPDDVFEHLTAVVQ